MKKLLLFVLSLCFALVTTAADLNPYAYNLSSEIALNNPMRLNISFKLNVSALSVKVFVYTVDGEWEQEVNANLTNSNLTYTGYIDLSVVPAEYRGRDLKWRVDVYGEDRDGVESVGKVIAVKIPLSLDIDNNPESPYFGRIIVSQSTNNVGNNTQGLYLYDPQDLKNTKGNTTNGGIRCFPSGITPSTEGWYTKYHAIPYRVRIAQDGTGNIFATACDKSQTAYLWYIDPASPENGNSWKQILTTANVDAAAGGPDANLWNVGLDIREDGNNYKLLLLSTTTGTNTSFVAGYIYSGEYTLSKLNIDSHTFNQSNYTSLSKYNTSEVKGGLVAHALRSSIAYDKNGGVWYTGTTIMDAYKTMSGVIHRTTSGTWKTNYATSWEALQRQYIFSGGIRHNKQFDKVVITNGSTQNTEKQALLFTVNYGASNPTLSEPVWLPKLITPSSGNHVAYTDVAWDYGGNIYLCAGYDGISHDYGIYAVATDLNGEAVSTEVRDTYIFTVECDGSDCTVIPQSNNVSWGTVSGGGTQISCTEITVVATPTDENKYRFMHWKDENDNIVSTNATYTFMVVRDITLTAVFEFAEYNVTWHNLFQNHQDVTDGLLASPSMDNYTNHRLWRWLQVEYAQHRTDQNRAQAPVDGGEQNGEKNSPTDYKEWNVAKFFSGTGGYHITDLKSFMPNENKPFYWLGIYIKDKIGKSDDHFTYSSGGVSYNIWAYYLYMFINRTSVPYNSENGSVSLNGYFTTSFVTWGKPEHWRPYWTRIACKLPDQIRYDDDLPKSWTTHTITSKIVSDSYKPQNWYKWNNQEANPGKLLGWYYDDPKAPQWPTNPTIVRSVYQSGALFATWVEKLISEEKTIQNNSDAIWLLNYHNGTHDIKILRKMQGGMYNTLCLPFSATKAQQPAVLQNATIVQFTGVNENLYDESGEPVVELQFTKVDDIVAGVPYLVMPQTDITSEMTFTNIPTGYNGSTPLVMETAQEITKSTNNGSISFIGNIHPTNIPAQSLIVVANNRLAEVTEAGEIQHMRGYFRIDDAQLQTLSEEGKVYLSMRKPTTTSVPLAPEAEQPTTPKVEKIMRDGQIYIIRDGVTYTITGARVK